ncbi:MAG: hypothetical protein CVT61_00205 [Actinobacteria bacterium HGW-Actinobacteria-11]|nr:MAG: hypothetical protein CVT61_00205 [Actinobacteria bacterium HGW-Actinobacteria-11]
MRAIYSGGNRIVIGIGARFEDRPRTVRLSVPDGTELTPDSARRTAVTLIEYAAQAERYNQQKGAS